MFDYLELPKTSRGQVLQRVAEIKGYVRQTAVAVREIGLRMIEVKQLVGHGNFLPWLKLEFPDWSERSVRNFMLVADQFRSANLADSQLSVSALYLLSAPSTPTSARDEALVRASEGERITYRSAQGIVDKHSAALSPTVAAAIAGLPPEEQLAVIQDAERRAVEEDDEDEPDGANARDSAGQLLGHMPNVQR